MQCGKNLPEGEKLLVVKEIVKAKTTRSVGERINCCVMKEIGECCKDFWKNPSKRKCQSDCGGLNLFSSGIFFNEAKLPNKTS